MADPLVKALLIAAEEIAGWGAGNEAGIVRAAAKRIESLREALTACEADRMEQARLNGMGSERELRLMARVKELEREVARAFRRGVEDAAKVAERYGSVPSGLSDGCGTRVLQAVDGVQLAAAIRALSAKDGEG